MKDLNCVDLKDNFNSHLVKSYEEILLVALLVLVTLSKSSSPPNLEVEAELPETASRPNTPTRPHLKSAKNKLASSGTMCLSNPCICISLETGVKIIAVVDIMNCLFNFALCWKTWEALSSVYPLTDEATQAIEAAKALVIVMIIVNGLQTFVSCGLWSGAANKNTRLCKLWVVISVLSVIMSIVEVWQNPEDKPGMAKAGANSSNTSKISAYINIADHLYFIWVVVAFIQQVPRVERGAVNTVVLAAPPAYVYQPQYPSQVTPVSVVTAY
ncbi:unnamed protein product [Orchesella dallaii]|uniref:Transmembrane protein n=1 Tax=Orchesella dallaii TaxID=48710 RepID=A0ABP1R1F0_9HEXA